MRMTQGEIWEREAHSLLVEQPAKESYKRALVRSLRGSWADAVPLWVTEAQCCLMLEEASPGTLLGDPGAAYLEFRGRPLEVL